MTETTQLIQSAEEAYKDLLPLAIGVERSQIEPYPGQLDIARHNLTMAHEAVAKLEEKLVNAANGDKLKAKQSIKLILATEFAALRIENMECGLGSGVLPLLLEARALRWRLLTNAEVAAEYGLLPKESVENIKRGKAQISTARDCIALASLYREFRSKLTGKSPIPEEDIERSSALGSQLNTLFKADTTVEPNEKPEEVALALELRDRFWTLLLQQRELLWKLAKQVVDPKEMNDVVPPILAPIQEKKVLEIKKEEAKEVKEKPKVADKEPKPKTTTQATKATRKSKSV
jgi:hypothetical protein